MKITWNKNPLYTTVELNEHEKEVLWHKIREMELEEMIYSAYHTLTHHDWHNANIAKLKPRTLEETMNEAAKELDPDYWCSDETSKLDERVNELLAYCIDELMGYHVGDCTCVPCSCGKCHAESLLGVETIKGLGKHAAHKINVAFGENNERTIDEAIQALADYDPTPPKDITNWENIWGKHLPRWREEAKAAHEWLKTYRDTHFRSKHEHL